MLIAFDTETLLIRPGLQTPPVVCLSYALIDNGVVTEGGLLDRHTAPVAIREWLSDPRVSFTNAEIAFDFASLSTDEDLLRLVFDAYEQDRITDVFLRQKLIDLACGEYGGKLTPDGNWVQHKYDLASLVWRHFRTRLDKSGDTWRLRYGELWDVPLDDWPQPAKDYALADALWAARVHIAQDEIPTKAKLNFPGKHPLADQYRQARGAFWLKLMSAWGLRTDAAAVKAFAATTRKAYIGLRDQVVKDGLMRCEYKKDLPAVQEYLKCTGVIDRFIKQAPGMPPKLSLTSKALKSTADVTLHTLADWSTVVNECDRGTFDRMSRLQAAGLVKVNYVRNTKAAAARMISVCKADGIELKYTKTKRKKGAKVPVKERPPNVALDADTCEETGDELLGRYADLSSLGKTISADIPWLETGSRVPIHSRFEPLRETGRTASSAPNVQNMRRLEGIRECYVPRPGYVFIDCDYAMLELHTLAQVCLWALGWSTLAEALNAGIDPHTQVGATIAGVTYAEGKRLKEIEDAVFAEMRGGGKVVNFGRPGGLGAKTLVSYASKGYGIKLTLEKAKSHIEDWNRTWREMPEFFAYVNSLKAGENRYNVFQFYSERLRADATFCSACNSLFQGLGADVAKQAGWYLARECYTMPSSPLYDARPALFVHDQFLTEVKEDRAHEAGLRQQELMNQAGREILPDVPCKADLKLTRRYSKKAKKIVIDGRLVPWDLEAA